MLEICQELRRARYLEVAKPFRQRMATAAAQLHRFDGCPRPDGLMGVDTYVYRNRLVVRFLPPPEQFQKTSFRVALPPVFEVAEVR